MTTPESQPAKPRLSIGDVLRHLVTHAPTYGEDNRAALLEAVNAEYAPPEPVQAELTPEEQKVKDEQDAKTARIAELEAQVAELRGT